MNLKNVFLKDDEQAIIKDKKEDITIIKNLSSDDKTWGMLAHLSALSSIIIPLGNILGPLLIWVIKKDDSTFINENGKNALNFQLSLTIYSIIGSILFFMISIPILFGTDSAFSFSLIFVPFLLFYLIEIFLIAKATGQTYSGKIYKYPFTIPFIK